MFKKTCPNCDRKTEKSFNFCPYCGFSFARNKEQADFGLIGKDDNIQQPIPNQMPSLNKIMNNLIKQLGNPQSPKGFSIQISTAMPQEAQLQEIEKPEIIKISDKEIQRRKILPKQEAVSNIRRLNNKIIYEISVPGVKQKKDIIISRMENGIEIKAYSKNICFYKQIPIRVDILKYYVKENTLFLELRG